MSQCGQEHCGLPQLRGMALGHGNADTGSRESAVVHRRVEGKWEGTENICFDISADFFKQINPIFL